MARKNRFKYRPIIADAVYGSKIVGQLINKVMRNGEKLKAEKFLYQAIAIVKEKIKEIDPLVVLEKAKNNVSAGVKLLPRRIGGSTVIIPFLITPRKDESIALNLLVKTAKNNKDKQKPFYQRLAQVILDAYEGTGKAVERVKQILKTAEENKGYINLRW